MGGDRDGDGDDDEDEEERENLPLLELLLGAHLGLVGRGGDLAPLSSLFQLSERASGEGGNVGGRKKKRLVDGRMEGGG